MRYPPAYEIFWNDARPKINWDTPDNKWVGIWGYDVPDLLGTEILRSTDKFEYEVWQPDLRANRVYSYTFKSGLTHKNFPAASTIKLFGAKLMRDIRAKSMTRELLRQSQKENLILHFNDSPVMYKDFMILPSHLPIIFDFRGTIFLPHTQVFSRTKNIPSKFNHMIDYYWLKKNINKIDYIIYRNDTNIQNLKKIYHGEIQKLTSGCDFSFWYPKNSDDARNELGLPKDVKIFFIASRFVDAKRIDKLILLFSELSERYDFFLVIAGHGLKRYEDYLKKLSMKLLKKNKIQFTGYLTGVKLRSYYNACDFFISASTSEGASVAVMQAFACEVPVISTKTGHTAELMEKYDCGYHLNKYNYLEWKKLFEDLLNGRLQVRAMDRNIAKAYYDWPNIVRTFIDIYSTLAHKYYS